ncbi:hypothetical protein, partial [Pseudomonas syringae]|uniref:hypothetical protein n=1 Tax=Pseudomonas syringae TaxID=317 RepID=UPI0024466DE1
TNNANLRRCAPTAWPDERGIGGRMLVDWVAGWRGMRTEEVGPQVFHHLRQAATATTRCQPPDAMFEYL